MQGYSAKLKLATLFLALASLFFASDARAFGLSEAEKECVAAKNLIPLQVPIIGACDPNSDSVCCSEDGTATVAVKGAPDYINTIFKFGIIFIAILLVGVLVLGGLMYTGSGGNPERAGTAMSFIKNAAYSLVVLIFSVVILNQVNPRLVSLNVSNVKKVAIVKCCKMTKSPFEYYFSTKLDEETNEYSCETGDKDAEEKLCVDQNLEAEDDAVQFVPSQSQVGTLVPITGDNMIIVATENTVSNQILPSVQAAASSIKPNYKMLITSGARSLDKQKSLITENCQNPAGSQTCNPKPGRPTTCILRDLNPNNCPHTSGVAIDAWGADLSGKQCISQTTCKNNLSTCFSNTCQKAVIDAMKAQGFCVLSTEPWHFEKPKLSAKCIY